MLNSNEITPAPNYVPLIEVMRAGYAESVHAGALAVVRPSGEIVMQMGNVERAVFPRSAVKIFQALPLVESGAAAAFKFTDAELALACASHSGEAQHVAVALGMLMKAGLKLADLDCGAHAPTRTAAARALAVAGEEPSVLHNNCSGKHIGMLATCKHLGLPLEGYTAPDHPLQLMIRAGMEAAAGVTLAEAPCGVDGCSVPTWAVPLHHLAGAFARIGSGRGITAAQGIAASALMEAVWANPFLVAGTKRFDSDVMGAFPRQLFTKVGAEGIYCGYFPAAELGVAIKCADGAERGANAIMAAIVQSILAMPKLMPEELKPHLQPKLTNWRGIRVGEIQPTAEFVEQLISVLFPAVV